MENLTHQIFHRWRVLSHCGKKGPHQMWLCRCRCGTERVLQANSLKRGATKSCGCLRQEVSRQIHTKHGLSTTAVYEIWQGMKARCYYKKHIAYKNYGGRGIKICERWFDFDLFMADIGHGWFRGASLERVDVNKGYFAENCTWIAKSRQANNRTDTVYVETIQGRMTIMDAARAAGVSRGAMQGRVNQMWPISDMLLPSQRRQR